MVYNKVNIEFDKYKMERGFLKVCFKKNIFFHALLVILYIFDIYAIYYGIAYSFALPAVTIILYFLLLYISLVKTRESMTPEMMFFKAHGENVDWIKKRIIAIYAVDMFIPVVFTILNERMHAILIELMEAWSGYLILLIPSVVIMVIFFIFRYDAGFSVMDSVYYSSMKLVPELNLVDNIALYYIIKENKRYQEACDRAVYLLDMCDMKEMLTKRYTELNEDDREKYKNLLNIIVSNATDTMRYKAIDELE